MWSRVPKGGPIPRRLVDWLSAARTTPTPTIQSLSKVMSSAPLIASDYRQTSACLTAVAVYVVRLRLCSFKILAQKDGSVWHTGLVYGGRYRWVDTSPTSLIVILWIYTAVPITALDTKESWSTEREAADTRLAKARDESELSLSSGWCVVPGVSSSSVGAHVGTRGRTAMWAFPTSDWKKVQSLSELI
jgi:hypothetical protein